MTIADPGSDRNGKVEPVPPETYEDIGTKEIIDRTNDDLDAGRDVEMPPPWAPWETTDAYRSWELAIDELHALIVDELVDDHDPRMPED